MPSIVKRLRSLPQGAKASAAFFLSSVVTTGIAYLTTPIYTRLLTTEEYGQTAVFLTWLQVFGIAAMFCLANGVFNNGMLDHAEERDRYSFSLLMLSNIITLACAAVFAALYPLFGQALGLSVPLLLLMGAVFLFQPAYSFWVARQRYEYKYKTTVIWAVLAALISPLTAILCIRRFPDQHLYARLFGAEAPLILMYIGFYVYLGTKSRFRVERRFWKEAFAFNLPLIPHYLSTYLLANSDKIMISRLVSDSATAFYNVAYTVASVGLIVWSAANASLLPFTYGKCKKRDYAAINRVTMPILTLFALVSLAVILFAPEVVKIMSTSDYYEAISVIPPIVGGVFFQVQYFIYANIVYYYKKPRYVMAASVTAMLLNLGLNYVFILRYGYAAAAYTTLLCYMVQAGIDYLAMRKVARHSVYDMKFVGALSLGVVAAALLGGSLYAYDLLRYGLVLALCALCIWQRGRIRQALGGLIEKTADTEEEKTE